MVGFAKVLCATICSTAILKVAPAYADEPVLKEEFLPFPFEKVLPQNLIDAQLAFMELLAQKFLMPLGLTTPLAGLFNVLPLKILPPVNNNHLNQASALLPVSGHLEKEWNPTNYSISYGKDGLFGNLLYDKVIYGTTDMAGNPLIASDYSGHIQKYLPIVIKDILLGLLRNPTSILNEVAALRTEPLDRQSQEVGRNLRGASRNLEQAGSIIHEFAHQLSQTLGGGLNVDAAMNSLKSMPPDFLQDTADLIESYGEAFIKAVEDGAGPISAMVQQLAAPLEGDGIPFFPKNIFGLPLRLTRDVVHKVESNMESLIDDAKQITAAESMASRRSIIELSRQLGALFGNEEPYGNLAAAFVDEFLIPSGLTPAVAKMLMEAWQVEENREALKDANSTEENDSDEEMNALVDLSTKVGNLIGTEAFHAQLANTFGKLVLAPLQLLRPVSNLLSANSYLLQKYYSLKSALLKFGTAANRDILVAILTPKALGAQHAQAGLAILGSMLDRSLSFDE